MGLPTPIKGGKQNILYDDKLFHKNQSQEKAFSMENS
jgi:hypothetical protein